MDLDLQGVPLIPLRNNGVPILSQRGHESAGHAFQMALYNGLKTKIRKRQGAASGKGWWAVPTPVRHLAAFDRSDCTKLSFGHIHTWAYLFFAQLHAAAICFGLEWTQCLNKTWGAFACAGSCPYWLDSGKTAPLHAAAICFGLEWTQCLNKTWGAFACAGSCPYWLDSGKTAPGIPPGLPHHHSTDHGPKECFGNGPFHINPAVIGSGGDPFRQMDEILSQKMFLEVFSADFLCSDPKRAVSGRFVMGSSVRVRNSSQRKFIIAKVGDKAWVVGEGGLEFALHAAAICFGLEWTQCLNKTWGAFACAGSCPYWLDSGKTAPGIPSGLPHHHSMDHGPKECFGNGPFHINLAVIGSGGDPFRQMDEILSQKMFLEVFSADFLCLDPKRAVSGRFVVGSSVQIGNSSQRKFIISKVGDKAWVVGEGGLEFADMTSLSRYV
ncbi:unnamed protein product [Notodromas monacha]|uniref:Uncharacterized protein n=1 Tax=Notodromas monacha TaxID=399045 RepID=A0A7R9GK26_9CRUS|nr:unnamed protein product [Notodromas monacha]CAG0924296.1 unnamed protein product [Notodromas monacha]